MEKMHSGNIDIWIDEIVPCLIDTTTEEVKETVVFKIESRSYLKNFTKKKGWHINWFDIPDNVDVYALALRDSLEIQGIIGLIDDNNAQAVYMFWACAAPQNNKHDFGTQKYKGVGGHLFAVAADISKKHGYGGAMHGYAANKELLCHYMDVFGAQYLGAQHLYHFFVSEKQASQLLEVYSYEWKNN